MQRKIQYDFKKNGDSIDRVIVAIHGLKGDRNSMQPLLKSMNIKNSAWYFLEAPYESSEGIGKSWSYEISKGKWEIEEPKALLSNFFYGLLKKYNSEKVFVLGFSQGAMVCLDFVLFLDQTLGGIFPICGFFREPEIDIFRFHICQKNTPILLGHGENDHIVPVEASKNAFNQLKQQGANVDILIYKGRHKIGMRYIKKIIEIIDK